MGVSPYNCYAEAKKRRDPQGFASLTIVVLIACHIHVGLERGSQGFTLKNRHQSLLRYVYGDKNDDSAVSWARAAFVPPLSLHFTMKHYTYT